MNCNTPSATAASTLCTQVRRWTSQLGIDPPAYLAEHLTAEILGMREVRAAYVRATREQMNAAPEGVYVHKAPFGVGKTANAAELLAAASSGIVVAPTRRLTLELARRCGAVPYTDLNAAHASHLAICAPSIANSEQFPQCAEGAELLFIDEGSELESCILTLGQRHAKCLEQVKALINASTKVILADAYANTRTLEFLRELAPHRPIYLVEEHVAAGRAKTVHVYARRAGGILAHEKLEALLRSGKKVAIACESVAKLRSLEAWVRRIVGADKIAVVAGQKYEGANNWDLEDLIDGGTKQVQVVMYTSAMGSGVSITDADFRHTFLFYAGHVVSPQQAHQMTGRFRNATHVHAVLGGNAIEYMLVTPLTAAEILQKQDQIKDETHALLIANTKNLATKDNNSRQFGCLKFLGLCHTSNDNIEFVESAEDPSRYCYTMEYHARIKELDDWERALMLKVPSITDDVALELDSYKPNQVNPNIKNLVLRRYRLQQRFGSSYFDDERLLLASIWTAGREIPRLFWGSHVALKSPEDRQLARELQRLRPALQPGAVLTAKLTAKLTDLIALVRKSSWGSGVASRAQYRWMLGALGFRVKERKVRSSRVRTLELLTPNVSAIAAECPRILPEIACISDLEQWQIEVNYLGLPGRRIGSAGAGGLVPGAAASQGQGPISSETAPAEEPSSSSSQIAPSLAGVWPTPAEVTGGPAWSPAGTPPGTPATCVYPAEKAHTGTSPQLKPRRLQGEASGRRTRSGCDSGRRLSLRGPSGPQGLRDPLPRYQEQDRKRKLYGSHWKPTETSFTGKHRRLAQQLNPPPVSPPPARASAQALPGSHTVALGPCPAGVDPALWAFFDMAHAWPPAQQEVAARQLGVPLELMQLDAEALRVRLFGQAPPK